MACYSYQARDSGGALINGQLECPNTGAVHLKLRELGLFPVRVKSRPFHKIEAFFQRIFNPIRIEDKIAITRQLYTLFKAGMNIDEIFATLARQATNPQLKAVLEGVKRQVGSGSSLSAAISQFPQVFDRLYVNLIMAGEEAGILEKVLLNLSELLQKEATLKARVKSALLYPKIVSFVLVGAAMVLLTWVVPKFEKFYGHYKAELPLPTRILIVTGDFMSSYWWLVIIAMGFGAFFFRRWTQSKLGRIGWGKFLFRVPVFGPLNLKLANARFCHLLSALYGSGLPMTRCVELSAEVIDNGFFCREIGFVRGAIYQGKTLSEAMRGCKTFTPLIIDATLVGETSGALDDILVSMGDHYDMEIDHTLGNLTTLLEPILLFAIFGMVTVFALAIFLPMWGMSRVVNH